MKSVYLSNIFFLLVVIMHYSYTKNAVTGRKQLNLISEKELIGMSLTEYDNFLKQHKTLAEYDSRVIQVRTVSNKIKQAKKYYHPN